MPIQFDNYTPNKIENLKNHLVAMAAKGNAKFYEIFVDALKAVPKTDEPSEFDTYEDYMTHDTEQIRILIYNTNLSPRNDQYVFVLKARSRDEATDIGLHGFPAKVFSKNSLSGWREGQQVQSIEAKNFEISNLKKENASLREELQDAQEYIEQLTATIDEAKKNANKIGGVHWGDVLSLAVEGLVRRNTHIIAKIPGGSGLAGLIDEDNRREPSQTTQAPDTEVSFKKKNASEETKTETPTEPVLTEKEKRFIAVMKELEKHFSEPEMGQIMSVLDYFSKDRDFLIAVLEEIAEANPENKEQGRD